MKVFKNIIGIVVLLGLIFWGGLTLVNNKKKSEEETRIVAMENDSIAINTARVTKESIQLSYRANGTFEPYQEITFSSEVPGRIVEINVEEGSPVHKGQVLALIRSEAQSIDLSAAEAAYQNAVKDNQRMEAALKSGGVTQQQVDGSRLQLKNAKAQWEQAQIRVGDTHIKSTINGIVNQRMIEPGSIVSPGVPMFEIVNITDLKLKVEVGERQVSNFEVGDEIEVKASVYPQQEFKGKITFIAAKATSSMNFPVHIKISNSADQKLKAGMYGTAIFSSAETTAQKEPVLVVPRSAFVGGLNNAQLFVIENGKAKLTNVIIGENFGDKIEIKSGLEEGMLVATSGHINLNEGSTVKVITHED